MDYFRASLVEINKHKANTFYDVIFPVREEIETKIRNKTTSLRKKIQQKIKERDKSKNAKGYEQKRQEVNNKKESISYQKWCKLEKEVTILDLYDPNRNKNKIEEQTLMVQISSAPLDQKDEQATLMIHILMRKQKPIFKVDEIKRKLKGTTKRVLKDCDCCGKLVQAKHRCIHSICNKKCNKYRHKMLIQFNEDDHQIGHQNDEDEQYLPNQPDPLLRYIDQQVIQNNQNKEVSIRVVSLRSISQEPSVPQINRIEQQIQEVQPVIMMQEDIRNQSEKIIEIQKQSDFEKKRQEEDEEQQQIIEKDKISQNQSKSNISQQQQQNKMEEEVVITFQNEKFRQIQHQKPIETIIPLKNIQISKSPPLNPQKQSPQKSYQFNYLYQQIQKKMLQKQKQYQKD